MQEDGYLQAEEAYESGFSSVYDRFMDEVPYDRWADRIRKNLAHYGVKDDAAERKILVDLGCGTGQMTRRMADFGYDCIGVDLSEEMLAVAGNAEAAKPRGILYLNQDMRELDLYGCAGQVISCCDSVNYLVTEEDMAAMLRQVEETLLPGGLFVFDFNTLHKYRDTMGEKTIAENRVNESFVWENHFLEEAEDEDGGKLTHINVCDVTFYIREGDSELFRRYAEQHWQRGWTLAEMKALLEKTGFELLEAVDDDTDAPAGDKTERVVITARKKGTAS
ncbi:MAG: class I SAM-dependent methyltransferase [Lachnospiraceae bacterium]|jgi:SAM-dependent methyltransferase|nr:class I SAM-dependent methyltransferase [Lachnospiraceae bacterium]MCI1397217.1 class I SAM-dependent methyltransferase [Lachnospiraceae bacterium]MCI1423059.1 class I SAM-dependent methyltransferase [Lachnospiraceae bacterium]MCI1451832.1 class I SAM-dependent methyltransferase [Lachnospiraceae bacterium]